MISKVIESHVEHHDWILSKVIDVAEDLRFPIAWGPHRLALPRLRAWLFMFDDSHDLYEVAQSRGLSERHASVKSNKVFRIFARSEMHAFQLFRAEFGDSMNDKVMIFQMNYQ